MSTVHARKKHIAVTGQETKQVDFESLSIPTGTEPTDEELKHILTDSVDDSALVNTETWMYRWGIFGCVCIVGVSVVTVTYRLTLSKWELKTQTLVETQEPSMLTPTPTSIVFDRSQMRVHVMNASGVQGRARQVLDRLVKRGYVDDGVETGLSDERQTRIYVSKDAQDHIADIRQDVIEVIDHADVDIHMTDETSTITIILGSLQ